MMMSSMLYLSSFLLLSMWSNVLATTDNQLTHPALNKTDATLRRPSNQLTVDQQEDDDYYSDNEPSDSIDSDYAAPKYSNPIWITPTPSPPTAPPSTTPTTPMRTSSSTAMPMAMASSLKRVPRHPQYLWHANRVDDDAAFDEAGYQSDQAVGTLTAQKQQEVGTAEGVQLSRRLYASNLRGMAFAHLQRINNEARCRWPQPRVIHINSETSKHYSPRATILHRCDEGTGCCEEDFMVCSVKTKATVELPFFVKAVGSPRASPQMLSLTNHTECECVSLSAVQQTQRRKRSSQCLCPKHFSNFSNALNWHHGTSCRCDCHLNDATCQRLKNGDEGFSMSERRCILYNDCSPPICNYGLYNSHSGRCPRPQQRHL
ncbi:uncharacterized protein LOC132796142 isoform X1 [Drosophila nasuta]|uniref:uncharacterized protein LOC132796142 isoform X1 n=2 Tax=Drosophila nasuta TaxID=42062 RepID=UPI00295E325B|nr:uncharacterized protein LOC132796142 isoform X1 [Drosophila nasuta]